MPHLVPYGITEKQQGDIVKATAAGMPITYALKLARVVERTYYKWLERAREGREPYAGFMANVEAARAQHALRCMMVVQNAAVNDHDVKAAQWLLQSLHKIGPTTRTESVVEHRPVDGGVPLEELEAIPTSQLADLYARIMAGPATSPEDDDVIEAEEQERPRVLRRRPVVAADGEE